MKHKLNFQQPPSEPGLTFNSFEDETRDAVVNSNCWEDFQFLWGWNKMGLDEFENWEQNLSIPLRMKQEWLQRFDKVIILLSIPLRMKLNKDDRESIEFSDNFQFLWGWNRNEDVKTAVITGLSFNSFEDETNHVIQLIPNFIDLSIPLRMKRKQN